MALQNSWVRFTDRSYEQIKTAIINQFPTKTPELTDYTENNIFVRLVSVWAGVTEMIGYYINVISREFYLSTARYYSSAVKTALLFNYRIKGVTSSTTTVRFTSSSIASSDILFPKYTKVKTINDLEFITLRDVLLVAGSNFIDAPVTQGILIESKNVGTSNGNKSQRISLGDSNIDDSSIEVTILGEKWTFVDNLALLSSTDKSFTMSIDEDKKAYLAFGDGINGLVPNFGSAIIVTYIESKASVGNIPKDTINELVSTISTPNSETITVTNINPASGGAEVESLADLQRNIPLSLRTLNRGVTIQDVKDLVLLYQGIDSVILEKVTNGVNIYISPVGGGNTSQVFRDALLNYLKDKMQQLVLINFVIKDVYTIYPKITVDVKLKKEYTFTNEVINIKNNIINYISNLDINEPLLISNLYQLFENNTLIDYSDDLKLEYELPIVGTKLLKVASFVLKATDNPINNLYKVRFDGGSDLTLFKNDISLLTFKLNIKLDVDDFSMTVVDDSYSVGDSWEFYIYNKNKSIYPSTNSNYKLEATNLVINEI